MTQLFFLPRTPLILVVPPTKNDVAVKRNASEIT